LIADSARQEKFCDEFARALLVPPQVGGAMPETPVSIVNLQRRFDVSLELAARALAASHPAIWVAVFVECAQGATAQWMSTAKGPRWVQEWVGGLDYAAAVCERARRDWTVRVMRLPARRQVIAVGQSSRS
jgi:Zn-dependent peptidase ImmA (M78 family)